ncbi:MAG: replication initiation factor domain-containing protein [Pseudomonadota bacterium]
MPPSDDSLGWLFPYLTDLFGISALLPKNKGAAGYKTSYDMNGYGLLALGGKGQRGTVLVSLTGKGCTRINNWPAVQHFLEGHRARLKRVDVAHDDLQGTTLNMESAVLWYHGGGFNSGGRTPEHSTRGDWLTPGSPKGRTLYVGNRANGKYCRIYEKGKQLGEPSSPWVRGEVEFKDESRVLPYAMLTQPGDYLAGAYPCLAYLSHAQEKIKTITKAVSISYDASVHHARQTVGRLVNVMMQMNGGDAFAVLNQLKREGVPRRLKNYADFLPMIIDGGAA